jgi:hypothetical protein
MPDILFNESELKKLLVGPVNLGGLVLGENGLDWETDPERVLPRVQRDPQNHNAYPSGIYFHYLGDKKDVHKNLTKDNVRLNVILNNTDFKRHIFALQRGGNKKPDLENLKGIFGSIRPRRAGGDPFSFVVYTPINGGESEPVGGLQLMHLAPGFDITPILDGDPVPLPLWVVEQALKEINTLSPILKIGMAGGRGGILSRIGGYTVASRSITRYVYGYANRVEPKVKFLFIRTDDFNLELEKKGIPKIPKNTGEIEADLILAYRSLFHGDIRNTQPGFLPPWEQFHRYTRRTRVQEPQYFQALCEIINYVNSSSR